MGWKMPISPNPKGFVLQKFVTTPLNQIAPLLEQSPERVVQKLSEAGLQVSEKSLSIQQIARANGIEPFEVVTRLIP